MRPESEADRKLDSITTVLRGASIFTVGKLLYNLLELALNVVLTRAVGASLYGVYAYASIVLTAVVVLTNGGTDKSVLKYLPQYEDRPGIRRLMLGLAFVTSIAGGMLAALSLLVLAPVISEFTLDSPRLTSTLRIFALIVLFDTVAKIINSTFRAVERVEYEVAVDRLVKPALRLAAVVTALYLGFSFISVMTSLLVASILALGVSVWLFFTRLDVRPAIRSSELTAENVASYYKYSVPLVAKDGAQILRSRVDILMVGLFLSSASVGIYNVALLIASLLVLPLSAFNQLFPPVISRLYTNGRRSELDAVFSTVTRWTFSISLFLGLGAIAYRVQILSLFGAEFVAGSAVLVLFVVGQLVNNAAGPSGYVLMMTEHQYVILLNQVVFGLSNVVLNYALILEFGLIGAAVATVGTLAALNVVRVVEVWYLERLFPYSIEFLNPAIAGALSFACMWLLNSIVPGLLAMIAGGALGAAVFAAVLLGIGIEDEDRELLNHIRS